MIANLCSWAPTREASIDVMREALDGFEIEGIGHNLPFLSAVMDHPRFMSGNITTAFIEEEYPDGFAGAKLDEQTLKRISAACAAMFRVAEIRNARVSGRIDNHERKVGGNWIIKAQNQRFDVGIEADREGSTVLFSDGTSHRVSSEWVPGRALATFMIDDTTLVLKVAAISGGYKVRYRGAEISVVLFTPRRAELAEHMLEKLPPDTSKLLLCPMPGLIVNMNVAVGDEVQDGQALCTVEAMKMENVLRAEKQGVVSKINAAVGDSLAVDETILEFE
jgi:propionyl-CoA carboxylase alpha chain